MKTVLMLLKRRKQSRKERLETKQSNWKFDFQWAKEFQKIERNQRFRDSESSNWATFFRTEKLLMLTLWKKGWIAKPHQKNGTKEERWFELKPKWKDKIRNQCSVAVCSFEHYYCYRIRSTTKLKFCCGFVV
jgi:hypothetical protein